MQATRQTPFPVRTVIVERVFQLGASSTFSVRTAQAFAAQIRRDRCTDDLQGIRYRVRSVEDARLLGAEDTESGFYVRDLDVVIDVEDAR